MWLYIFNLFVLVVSTGANICMTYRSCQSCVVSNCIFYIHSGGNFCGGPGETRIFTLKIRRLGTCVSFAVDPLMIPTERTQPTTLEPYSLAWAEKPEETVSLSHTDSFNGVHAVHNVTVSANEMNGMQHAETAFSTKTVSTDDVPAVLNITLEKGEENGMLSSAIASKQATIQPITHNRTDVSHPIPEQSFQFKISTFICAQYMSIFQILHPKRSINKEQQRCMKKMKK